MKRTALALTLISALLFSAVAGTLSVYADENSWASKAPMPTPRCVLGVAVVNGKIYAIGGINGSIYINSNLLGTNEMYDPATDTWITKTPMPTPRSSLGITVCQNKIYVMGGNTGASNYTGVNEVYDPLTDTWETRTPMPTPRVGMDANVVDGKIYLIGGFRYIDQGASARAFNITEVYDPANDIWIKKAPLPTAVYGYASAVVNNKIYVIGGMGCNLTQVYNPATDTWSYGAPIPRLSSGATVYTAGAATTGSVAPKRIYVMGGGSLTPVYNLNRIYDPERDVWSNGTCMPTARSDLDVAVVDDVLYAIGGYTGWGGSYTGANEQYTPIGYGTVDNTAPPVDGTAPEITVLSPDNKTYDTSSIPLNFTVNEAVSQITYSLDGEENITITGNTTLTGLANGDHNLTIHAKDEAGNVGTSETMYFSVDVPFPTGIVVASIASMAVISASLLVYFKKRRH
jgi:N-acetylneuraminic acid mutarotase